MNVACNMKDRNIDSGWAWVVLFAVFCILMIAGAIFLSPGLLCILFLDAFPEDRMATDLAGTLLSAFSCLSGPIGGLLAGAFSCRSAMLIGSVIASVGLVSSAFVTTVNQLILTCGFITGTGLGIAYTPAAACIGFYFEKKRDFASGIALAGVGTGLAIFPPLFHILENDYGWRGVLLMLGGVTLHMAVFSALCSPSVLEKRKTIRAIDGQIDVTQPVHSNIEDNAHESKRTYKYQFSTTRHFIVCNTFLKEIFANRTFLFFNASLLTFGAGLGSVSLYLPSYLASLGVGKERTTLLLSVYGLGNLASRILTGLVTRNDIDNAYVIFIGNYGVAAICTMLAPVLCLSTSGQVAFVGILGFYSQGNLSLFNSLTIDMLCLKLLPLGFGIEMMIFGTGWLIGPPITGVQIRKLKSYPIGLVCAGSLLFVSALLGMTTAAVRPIRVLHSEAGVVQWDHRATQAPTEAECMIPLRRKAEATLTRNTMLDSVPSQLTT